MTAVPPRLDLRYDVTVLANRYLEDDIENLETTLERLTGDAREQFENAIAAKRKDLAAQKKKAELAETELRKSTDKFINQAATMSSPLERAALARQYGLVREAIAELHKAHEQFQKQLDNDAERKQFSVRTDCKLSSGAATLIHHQIARLELRGLFEPPRAPGTEVQP